MTKYQEMNLTKDIQSYYGKSCKSLLRDIKDLNTWKDTACVWREKPVFKRFHYQIQSMSNVIPVKVQRFLSEIYKPISMKQSQIAKIIVSSRQSTRKRELLCQISRFNMK